jgi:uncharacterized iron-regulated protein
MPVSLQTLHPAQLASRLIRMLTLSLTAALACVLSGCSWPAVTTTQTTTQKAIQTAELQSRLAAWLPADVLLLGEQHDAPAHQALEEQIVAALASRGQLSALALEMADSGSSTASLSAQSTEAQVRSALVWDNDAWPWAAYGPAVMAAVRAGVPVLGANLARAHFRASMADAQLDHRLPGPALKAQQQLIRQGHCDLLPESQITPMTRIQIARDQRMAETLQGALQPGRVVVLLAGSVHADRQLGVPQHLPPGLRVKSIRLQAGPSSSPGESFDSVWTTEAAPATDHCEGLRRRLGKN